MGTVKHKLDDSPMWRDLLKIKSLYLKGRTMTAKDGKATSFWLDTWILDRPLCSLYPVLFDMCLDKHISVHQFLVLHGQISFNRWLNPLLFEQWMSVVGIVYQHHFEDTKDIPVWKWTKGKIFSTNSVYEFLTKDDSGLHYKHIWKAKIPYKIKIFMWLVENNAILTKDNLIRRHWIGDLTCCFCAENENIDHLFFLCPIAKITWGVVGMCFGANSVPRNMHQYKLWIANWLPGGNTVYTSGCAAIC